MRKLTIAKAVAAAFLTLGVLGGVPAASAMEVDGSQVNPAALVAQLVAIAAQAAPGPGDFSFNTLTAGASLNAAQVINGIILHTTTQGTDTLPTAAALIAALPGGTTPANVIGRTFNMLIFNTQTPGTVTLVTNTGLTLAGTLVVAANQARWFFGQVTSAAAVTITDVAGFTIVA